MRLGRLRISGWWDQLPQFSQGSLTPIGHEKKTKRKDPTLLPSAKTAMLVLEESGCGWTFQDKMRSDWRLDPSWGVEWKSGATRTSRKDLSLQLAISWRWRDETNYIRAQSSYHACPNWSFPNYNNPFCKRDCQGGSRKKKTVLRIWNGYLNISRNLHIMAKDCDSLIDAVLSHLHIIDTSTRKDNAKRR